VCGALFGQTLNWGQDSADSVGRMAGDGASQSETTWIVIPTFNEAENLEAIVNAVGGHLTGDYRFLIVDDSSPDGTGEIADRLAAESDDLEVLHRTEKEGLGPAYLAGFRHALERGAARIVQMDADFSHDPADVPRLLETLQRSGADLVVGSRYVAGGGVSDWGAMRRFISRGGGTYAQAVLWVRVRDLTGGFKCWRREALASIDFDSVESKGYAFQIEMTYRAIRNGFRVTEMPIVFRDRRIGDSKMSGLIVAEAIWRVPILRFHVRKAR
jgi:dolichol-phosphate mannosyltransferase